MTESEIRWMPILKKAIVDYHNPKKFLSHIFYKKEENNLLLTCSDALCERCVYSNKEFSCTSNLSPRIADSEEAYQYVLNNYPEYLI